MPITHKEITKTLKDLGYTKTRTEGSHERRCNNRYDGLTVPYHKELAPGTALSILRDLAQYEQTTVQYLKQTYKLKV